MAYAQPEDVESRLGRPLTTEEATQTPVLLSDVELLIRSRIPDLDALVESGAILEGLVVMIEANAVVRVLRNPEGFRQEQEGDYMYTRAAATASGALTITDDEWRLLGVSAGAFTIAPYLSLERPAYPRNVWHRYPDSGRFV